MKVAGGMKCKYDARHGGRSWSGPDPKGGGGGALRTPKWLHGTMCFVGARDFLLGV